MNLGSLMQGKPRTDTPGVTIATPAPTNSSSTSASRAGDIASSPGSPNSAEPERVTVSWTWAAARAT